ncbi:fungal-specific transcription factor domain-containing protein [Mycena latifolia]|nr:fungal-specific transcription factor domain-containing protein [Mycena latifolia]
MSSGTKQRACDMCRRKKRRCDGGEQCNHCLKHNWTCTYVEPSAPRPVYDSSDSYDNDYVQNLKLRLERAEAALRETPRPGVSPVMGRAIRSLTRPFTLPHPDDSAFIDIADSFRALSLGGPCPDPGFQGKSSAAMLVKAAVEVRPGQARRSGINPPILAPKSWSRKPEAGNLDFPDDHLMEVLVSLYFSRVNISIPLLHRPTFDQCLSQRLHQHHISFASTLLLVCAVGSLYLTDPDVSKQEREALGWRWYNQVELCGHKLRHQPRVFDLEAYCLAAEFLIFTSNPRFSWSIVGFGMRLMEDVGAHRLKDAMRAITAEEELQKRAFWVLILFDTLLSAALGRSAVFDSLEYDIDLPSECDDEYWGPSGPRAQPSGKPSSVAFFNCLLNLYRIVQFSLRVFYCTTASQKQLKLTDLPSIAVQVDVTLNKWFAAVPKHLVWDPAREDALFFDQSASLHCFYYYARILIHRPFLPAVRPGTKPEPAVSICNEAAWACINVADIQRRRSPDTPLLLSQTPVFTACMILLLNMWDEASEPHYPKEALAHIHTGIDVLKSQQERWPSAVFPLCGLEQLASLDPAAATKSPGSYDFMDSTPEDNTLAEPHADVEEPRSALIPPAFVGDEDEIRPRRFRGPPNISF